ncbi:MAG: aconitate hydratase [Desulfopila sp.]
MGQNVTEKIVSTHLIDGEMTPGEEIAIQIDQTLWSDLTGIMAGQILETVGSDRVVADPSVIYCDHNTLATSMENADDHRYLKTIAQRYGLYFSKPGNGICHFLHCQRFARPGQTLLGADSHTPTSGALGMIAIGSGGLSVAKSMLGEGFRLKMPKVVEIRLLGRLASGVSAKDVALELLRIVTVKGGVGCILEFTGAGIDTLSVPQRATLANMSIEMGATTAVFPSDAVTRTFLQAQGRGEEWLALSADPDAVYAKTMAIDLTSLEPLAARPHMPDKVVKVRELGDVRPGSVFIGSCTNASFSDIASAAAILKGKTVHPDIDLTIAPGSRQVLEHLVASGILADIISANGRILESACGPCIGVGQVPSANGISVRTSNRNFQGRCGTMEAGVYLVSPETAAATAITGRMTDPRDVFDFSGWKRCEEPERYHVNDKMIIPPSATLSARDIQVLRGKNISSLPEKILVKDRLQAGIVLKLGDDVTTDDIIPAGADILKHIANIPRFAEFTFCYTDPGFVARARQMHHSVIIGGHNYGQGSSREHAALLPMFLGVEAVIAKSFARIHKENLMNYGILPLIFKDKNDYLLLQQGDVLIIDDVPASIDREEVTVWVKKSTTTITVLLEASIDDRAILQHGGAVPYLQRKLAQSA